MTGVPLHQVDMHGRPIFTGDVLVCYPVMPTEQAIRFRVEIGEHGLVLPKGLLPHELSERCEVVV